MLIRRLRAGAAGLARLVEGENKGGGDSDTITLVTSSVAEAMGVRENGKFRNYISLEVKQSYLRRPVGPKGPGPLILFYT